MSTIRHYANFPATGVSLRQMVQFGDKPSTGTFLLVLTASFFLFLLLSNPIDPFPRVTVAVTVTDL